VFDGLEILFEGIQDQNSNFTRFFVLTATQDSELPCPATSQTRCLVRLFSRRDIASPTPAIMQLLTALDMTVFRLDRRPQFGSPEPFHDVYFAELQKGDSSESWNSDVEQAIERVRASGGEAELLGIW